jgi:hypothetical protein
MDEELFEGEGISRRDMLKRSAIVGGASALVWAAPSVTTFAPRAFGANGTPASEFSNFGAILRRANASVAGGYEYIKIKGEYDDKSDTWDWEIPGNLGQCEQLLPSWGAATGVDGKDYATFVPSGTNYLMTLLQSAIDDGWAFANNTDTGMASSLKQGQCCIKAAWTATQLTWYGPFPNGNSEPCSSATKNGQVGYDAPPPPNQP